ncbi:MAG TPA: C40 family peptidase [Actinoplanes sp.]|nr:C40 family peptidase [Actinoplanes sp.]
MGSRPMALGTLVLPGQATATTPAVTPVIGAATSPALQQIEKGRAEIATMGDELIQVGQDRDLAKAQQETAAQKYEQSVALMQDARSAAASAAAKSVIEAAAMPPGAFDSGLAGLDDLARLQRGDTGTELAAARQLETAETSVQLTLDEENLAKQRYDELVSKYNKLNTQLGKKQTAQQALELAHADELTAAEATETATDSRLGAQYLAGASAGRGADPRAIKALEFALAERGDPYLWSAEGPNAYDCSGLMWAAYRSVGFQLARVSRDQYWQTHEKVVDRYSLLPGDLLFFSYSNSWRGIHHVAMYAGQGPMGQGLMVEAPRTGLNVRLVPVRWSRLFQATRVFGSVPGVTEGPTLGRPDPDTDGPTTPDNTTPATTSPTPSPSATTSKPGTTPPTTPGTTKPTTDPTTTKPTTDPTTTKPTTDPTTTGTPTTEPTGENPTSQPTGTQTTTPSGANSSSGSNPPSGNSSAAASSPTSSSTSSAASTSTSSAPTTSTSTSSASTPSSSSTSSATAAEHASASASAS